MRLFLDTLQDLLLTLRTYADRKDRLFFTVCYDCKALSEKGPPRRSPSDAADARAGFTPLLQTLKITSQNLWRDVHEIKFPLPPGGHVDVSNEFIIPLTQRVLKKTVQTCTYQRHCVRKLIPPRRPHHLAVP